MSRFSYAVALVCLAILLAMPMAAHEMIVKGTVWAVEASRLQVRTGEEARGSKPSWYPIDRTTRIRRGDKDVTRAEADIRVDERVVLIVDHPDQGPMKTKEIRLAAR
jgi:hypothetical protein